MRYEKRGSNRHLIYLHIRVPWLLSSPWLLLLVALPIISPVPTSTFLTPASRLKPSTQDPILQGPSRRIVARASNPAQEQEPIVDALEEAAKNIKAPFFFPGHKMGREFPLTFTRGGTAAASPWQYDLPEIPELDNLFAPEGPIKDAEELAAAAFGARKTWFLVNGSTAGVLAAIMACVRRHQQLQQQTKGPSKVILPLNVHKSAINALVLSGAEPVFITPFYDAALDVCHGIPSDGAGGLAQVLAEHAANGEVAAVMIVSPTYHGVMSDVGRAVELCRAMGVPLIVDEAHGAHLRFLPDGGMQDALSLGADLVVQSTHKTLSALSQAGMIHAGPKVDEELQSFVSSVLQMVQSSSPNYLLLASLDAARRHVASDAGKAALERAKGLAAEARRAIEEETAFHVLSLPTDNALADGAGLGGAFVGLDPLRLTVYGDPPMNGYAMDEDMIEGHGVYAELPASRTLTFAFGPGSKEADVPLLVGALKALSAKQREEPPPEDTGATAMPPSFSPHDPLGIQRRRLCSPREAYMTPSELLPTTSPLILGRASAEVVCPYPPGIPILMPGEVVTSEALDYLKAVLQAGGSIMGCSDPTLETMRVLKST